MSRTAWQRKAPDAYWMQDDTAPAVSERLLDGNGNAVDLTGATVRFQGTWPTSGQVIDNPAAVVAPSTSGVVSYTPLVTHPDEIGDLMVQWKVTFGGGAKETFPNSGFQKIRVMRGVT